MKTALVCIAKNEDNYIDEWIAYNIKLGFDHIFIYANDWSFTYAHPQVTIIDYPGENKQRAAYAHFLSNYKKDFTWAAFFDVDEYLVLKKSSTIREFLQDYSDVEELAINWVLFGDNGLTEVTDDYSLLRRFTKRQVGVNEHIKCILNLTNNSSRMDVHNPLDVPSTDTNRKKVVGPYNPYGDDTIAQLNHYYSKTVEEFKAKCDRGRADAYIKNDYSFHAIHNHNDIEETLAKDFLYK